MIKEAKRGNHTNLQTCVNFVTQIPHEVRSICKGWVCEAEGNMSDKETRTFITKVRRLMVYKGIPFDRQRVVANSHGESGRPPQRPGEYLQFRRTRRRVPAQGTHSKTG